MNVATPVLIVPNINEEMNRVECEGFIDELLKC
jgi:hypothetical protein